MSPHQHQNDHQTLLPLVPLDEPVEFDQREDRVSETISVHIPICLKNIDKHHEMIFQFCSHTPTPLFELDTYSKGQPCGKIHDVATTPTLRLYVD